MDHTALFNGLAKGTNAVLDVADTAITIIGVPLTGIWAGLQTAMTLGLGMGAPPMLAWGGAALAALGAGWVTYKASTGLTNVFRSSAENTKASAQQPAFPEPALA